jgi:hypothetical protein
MILDDLGLRFVLVSNSRRLERSQPLVLPDGCGRHDLVSRCFNLLSDKIPLDFALDILDLLTANSSQEELQSEWNARILSTSSAIRTAWLEYGLRLGCLPQTSSDNLERMLSDAPLIPSRIDILLRGRRHDYLEKDEQRFNVAVNTILDRTVRRIFRQRQMTAIDALAMALDGPSYADAFEEHGSQSMLTLWKKRLSPEEDHEICNTLPTFAAADNCMRVFNTARELLKEDCRTWATSLAPWDTLVEVARGIYGDRLALFSIANLAAGIKSTTERAPTASEFHDTSVSLCHRARYARLRAGSDTWWIHRLQESPTTMQSLFLTLLWGTWASSTTIMRSLAVFTRFVEALSTDEWSQLYAGVRDAAYTAVRSSRRQLQLTPEHVKRMPVRMATIMYLRGNPHTDQVLYELNLRNYKGNDVRVLESAQRGAVDAILRGREEWASDVAVVSRSFKGGVISLPYLGRQFLRGRHAYSIPLDLAKHVMERAIEYPSFLVAAAEARCRKETVKTVVPIAKIATRDTWFE